MERTHIEALKAEANARLDAAQTADEVKSATEIMAHIEEVEKGLADLEKQNAALLASYKSIVKSEAITQTPPEEDEDIDGGEGLDFAAALAKIKAAREK